MGMTHDLTALKVQDNSTGEILLFTITRAGLYNLAKYIAKRDNNEFILALKYLRNLDTLGELIGRDNIRWLFYDIFSYLYGDNVPTTNYYWTQIVFTNVKDCVDRAHFIEDCFNFGGRFFPKSYRKYIRKCYECGQLYFDQDLIHDLSIARKIPSRYLGIDGYCNDCFDRDVYAQCDDCGCIFDRTDDDYAIVDGDVICNDCLTSGDYYRCDHCGEWFRSDSDDARYPDGYCYCSVECCENDGWRWSERREEWVGEDDYDNDVDEIVTDYHSHEYYPVGEATRKNQKYGLYIGKETEVDGRNRYDFTLEYFEGLARMYKNNCFFETDGSLDEGFEIISQPMTEKEFFNMDWESVDKKLVADGWRSHDTSTCGTHFHYSDWYLGYSATQKKNSAKKICRFFQIFADDIRKIARRDFGHYCVSLENFSGGAITKDTDWYDLSNDRYWAVNLTNMLRKRKGTIEIRVCKGTLKTSTMLASADFFLHIVRNAKKISWKNIDNLSLWLKGINKKNTIEYLKARHAFVGAF